MTSPANTVKKDVARAIREMRQDRENALNAYVDALIQVNDTEIKLAQARTHRDEMKTAAKNAGNSVAELEEAMRIVKDMFSNPSTGPGTTDDIGRAGEGAQAW